MELTYMVRGGDGKEYGPVTLDQAGAWIREGRLTQQQEVKRSDMEHWAVARDFAELQPLFGPGAGPTLPPTARPTTMANRAAQPDPMAYAHLKSGASWFYWIAALSLINSIASFGGMNFRFIFGLGITQMLDALGSGMGSAGPAVALALDLVAAGIFVLFGVFAHKLHSWAFIVGMLCFAADTILLVVFQQWLDVALHLLVLFFLGRGFVACRKIKAAATGA
jgi:hypothetical protein